MPKNLNTIPTHQIRYDSQKWYEAEVREVNTLQIFITNRCNMRCPECFNKHNLGPEEMTFEQYCRVVQRYSDNIEKVILVGGEPTLHRQIRDIILYNTSLGKRTTIYTNGAKLDMLAGIPDKDLSVRISVFGLETGWKALRALEPFSDLNMMFTYMLKHDNIDELLPTAIALEEEYGCRDLLISTCRGQDYWVDYDFTLPLEDYGPVIDTILESYNGNMTLHIATRGILTGKHNVERSDKCRFGNVFIDKLIQCPFDIEGDLTTDEISFGKKNCTKHTVCLLGKIKLIRQNDLNDLS